MKLTHTRKITNLLRLIKPIRDTYLKTFKTLKLTIDEQSVKLEFPTKTKLLNYYKDKLPASLTSSILADENKLNEYLDANPNISTMIQNSLYYNNAPPTLLHDYPNIYDYKLEYSEFLSIQIHNCINNTINKVYNVTYNNSTNNNINITGNFKIYTNKNVNSMFIKKIAARILFFNNLLKTQTVPVFRIYMCPMKKLLPAKGYIFTPNNINSAVTDGTTILIYRSEELIKSIGHECIHFHGLDYREDMSHILDTSSYSVDNKNGQILFFEATTELLANVLNAIIISHERKKSVQECINIERDFAFKQKCKILYHCGCRSWGDFLNKTPIKLVESTNVLAYFILKSQFMWNLEKILNIIKFPNLAIDRMMAEELARYLEMIKNGGDESYINAVNAELMSYEKGSSSEMKTKTKTKTKTNKHVDLSTRMTILE